MEQKKGLEKKINKMAKKTIEKKAKLISSIEKTDLINLVVKDRIKRKLVTHELLKEGPKHKQVLTALLSLRLFKLTKAIETRTGEIFSLQKGYEQLGKKKKGEKPLGIAFPIKMTKEADILSIAKSVSHAPEHEILAFALWLQVIEWAIKTVPEKAAG